MAAAKFGIAPTVDYDNLIKAAFILKQFAQNGSLNSVEVLTRVPENGHHPVR
jgi:hypothetical protein